MRKILNVIHRFFDKIEDKARIKLVHHPIVYAFIGSVGIVSIWRGIWHISDDWGVSSWESLIFGILITVLTGLFVSFFIGENIIISGLNKEKRIDEKTEEEIHKERNTLSRIEKDIKEIKELLEKK
jgi:large-conductance mechanosensitive channel